MVPAISAPILGNTPVPGEQKGSYSRIHNEAYEKELRCGSALRNCNNGSVDLSTSLIAAKGNLE